MLTNQSFTDPQGQTYTDAVIMVIDFSCSTNRNRRLGASHDASDLANPSTRDDESENHTAVFKVAYWPSQAAFDAGNACYLLANMNATPAGTEWYASLTAEPVDVAALEAVLETEVTTNILPNL